MVMGQTNICICSYDCVYVWQYKSAQSSRLTSFQDNLQAAQQQMKRTGKENAWFIDDAPDQGFIYDKDKYEAELK